MTQGTRYVNQKHLLTYSLKEQLIHGMRVSNFAYRLAKRLGFPEDFCYDMAVAGMLHDIGKEEISNDMKEDADQLIVEEMHYVRLHARAGYEILKEKGYSQNILETVLYHHENMNGSGYPENLSGDKIPMGARIIRVCDVYAALTSKRPYRDAFDKKTAIQLMIEDIDCFDVKVFLQFQRMVHSETEKEIVLP